jgi:aconitate hydratase
LLSHDPFKALRVFKLASGKSGKYYALAALEQAGLGKVSRLPVSLRIVLESLLRNCDGKRITESHVKALAAWQPAAPRTAEIPFVLARILLQDLTGFLTLNDFASMRAGSRETRIASSRKCTWTSWWITRSKSM